MRIYCKDDKQFYDADIQLTRLENPFICPVCTGDRKKKHVKSANWNRDKNTGKCSHCQAAFYVRVATADRKEYKRPPEPNRTELSNGMVKYFEQRLITQEAIKYAGITEQEEWMPQVEKKRTCICFNYFRYGKVVNVKYRDGEKNFKLFAGAELIPYNLDGIKDADIAIWVEGEFDALAYISCGITNVLSVPNGAGKSRQNLQYIDNAIDELEHIKTHIIAVDQDEAGRALREEMIRRFGAENCKTVSFKDVKDANDYLIKYGYETLRLTIEEAQDVPLGGIYDIEKDWDNIVNLWANGMPKGLEIGRPEIDKNITWVSGVVAIWTGIPTHGKSEWVEEVATLLNVRYGWKVGLFSPENRPTNVAVSKLISRIAGKKFDKRTLREYELIQTAGYLSDNFFFIEPEDDDVSVESILEHAKLLVRKKGIKQLIIDPWNKLDHQYDRGESETQYISRCLDKIYAFAQRNDVLVHLVAHPTKMKKDTSGKAEIPTLYDINGSSHFYNKAFYGISIYRDGDISKFIVQKVKFRHLGNTSGSVSEYRFNINNSRFSENGETIFWDNTPYLQYEIPDGETVDELDDIPSCPTDQTNELPY